MQLICLLFVISCLFRTIRSVSVNRRKCKNDIECGVEFNDISGKLHEYVEFEAEYLLEGAAFDSSVWVTDCDYSQGGYLLFVILGISEQAGLYKLVEHNNKISVELIVLYSWTVDVAWNKKTPNIAYVTAMLPQQVIVVDLKSGVIKKIYGYFEGKQFAGPNGMISDDEGNIYFTDSDFNINPDADPDTTLNGGGLFRIDSMNEKVYLEGRVEYGYNGIALNNYGNGKRLVAGNTVDLPDYIYDLTNNEIWNVDNIYVDEYIKRKDGSLRNRGRYYSITQNLDRFPKKTFLDGMTFDAYDNLFVSAYVNQTMSKLVILNYNDCSDTSHGYTDYIGEIIFKEGFVVVGISLAGDGYFYAGLINYADFAQGEFVRFRGKGKNVLKKGKYEKNKQRLRNEGRVKQKGWRTWQR